MTKERKVYKFKKGELLHLDNIMQIQGLGGGLWWDKTGNDCLDYDRLGSDMGDEIIITQDITITIIVETG